MGPLPTGASLATAVATRHAEVVHALSKTDDRQLQEASRLPGWDRLAIACHLRCGALASDRITRDALTGTPTAYYPNGRSRQRADTLRPDSAESLTDVVSSLAQASERLDKLWANIEGDQWATEIREPPDNRDLGPITLWTLALLRLTEVEVHGYDLDLNLSPWSTTFVEAALPARLMWLPNRRSNHRATRDSIDGNWALHATDGPAFQIHANGPQVEVEAVEATPEADATITGTTRELLTFILGRAHLDSLQVRGNHAHAAAFLKAFPAP